MSQTVYYTGLAAAVAQVSNQTFGTFDVATTRKITIGGVTIQATDSYGFTVTSANATAGAVYSNNGANFTVVSTIAAATTLFANGSGAPLSSGTLTKVSGTGDATITFSASTVGTLTASLTYLAQLLNAPTTGYFSKITWTSNATQIIGTSKVAGLPFTMTGAVSGGGGTGTVSNSGVQVDSTASAGPNDWSSIGNWSTGVLPGSGDTVIFANNSTNVCWGLNTGVTGVSVIRCEQSYTGKIGLNYLGLAITADGATLDSTVLEYRPLYAAIGVASLRIGDSSSIGSSSGSPRLMFNLGTTTTSTVEVVNTANSSADSNRPAVRLLGNKTTHAVNVRLAPGGVGICAEVPGETSTVGTINVSDQTGSSKLVTGRGITINTSYIQDGGTCTLQSDNTMPLTTVNGGTLTIEGAGATTALNCYGGTTNHNASGTTTTITMRGGTCTSYGSAVARTWTNVQIYHSSTFTYDPSVVTLTNNVQAQERLTIAT